MVVALIVAILGVAYFALGQSDTTDPNDTGVNVAGSDGSLTGAAITNDSATWPGDDKVWNICAAIAIAEGYNGAGNASFQLNNPGDLSPGDEHGEATSGAAQWHGGSYVIQFATAEGGWRALHTKIGNIIQGTSHVYGPFDTWTQIGAKWAGNSAAWTKNVTSYLGVDPNTTPTNYVAS